MCKQVCSVDAIECHLSECGLALAVALCSTSNILRLLIAERLPDSVAGEATVLSMSISHTNNLSWDPAEDTERMVCGIHEAAPLQLLRLWNDVDS